MYNNSYQIVSVVKCLQCNNITQKCLFPTGFIDTEKTRKTIPKREGMKINRFTDLLKFILLEYH